MTAPDPVTCAACGHAVTSFAAWFSEDCFGNPVGHPSAEGTPRAGPGHQLTWLQLMLKQFEAHPERKEVTQP